MASAGSRTDTVRQALEYYLAHAEKYGAPGFWLGRGLELSFGLGVGTPVGRDEFVALMTCRDPGTGLKLNPRIRTLMREDRRPGVDMVFRMPKSVGMLYVAVPGARAIIAGCHEKAIRAALSYFENEGLVARTGAGGSGPAMATTGLMAAGFNHYSNRAGDPDIHTHVIVANLVQRADGTFAAMYTERLRDQAKALGYIHEMVLRSELGRELGLSFGPVVNGIAQLDGVPREAIEEFLTRSREIDNYIEEHGWPNTPKAREVAALKSRKTKLAVEHLVDDEQWMRRMEAHGLTREHMASLIHRGPLSPDPEPGPPPTPLSPLGLAEAEGRIIERLAQSKSTWIERHDVALEWAVELRGVSDPAVLSRLVDHSFDPSRGLIVRRSQGRSGEPLFVLGKTVAAVDPVGFAGLAEAMAIDPEMSLKALSDPRVVEEIEVRLGSGEAASEIEAGALFSLVRGSTEEVGSPQSPVHLGGPGSGGPGALRMRRAPRGVPVSYETLAAPVSVALFVAACPDRELAAAVLKAHRDAVRAVVEGICAETGCRVEKVLVEEGRRSDADCPALLTKAYLPGVDTYPRYRSDGALYSADLRHRLSLLGLSFERESGRFELAGFAGLLDSDAKSALKVFSQRPGRVEFAAALPGRGGPTEKIDARTARTLRDRFGAGSSFWASRVGADTVADEAGEAMSVEAALVAVTSPGGALSRVASFTASDVIVAMEALLEGGCDIEELRRVAADIGGLPGVITLDAMEQAQVTDLDRAVSSSLRPVARATGVADPSARYCLAAVLDTELSAVAASLGLSSITVPHTLVKKAIAAGEREIGAPLAPEQAAASIGVLGDGQAVSVIVGVPGAGKTTVLSVVADAYTRAGCSVLGAAHTGVAASVLGGAGVSATSTVDNLLARLERDPKMLGQKTVLIVDEVSQLDSGRLAKLLGAASSAGSKVVLVGDHRQQGAVEAGGLLAEIIHRKGAYVLAENRRQRDQMEREAVASLRQGWGEIAVQSYLDRGKVHVTFSHEAMLAGAVDEYTKRRCEGAEAVLLTGRSADVSALNALSRVALITAGKIDQASEVTLAAEDGGPLTVGPGEAVRFTKRNDMVTVVLKVAVADKAARLPIGAVCSLTKNGDDGVLLSSAGSVVSLSWSKLKSFGEGFGAVPEGLAASGVTPSILRAASRVGTVTGAVSARRGMAAAITGTATDPGAEAVTLRLGENEMTVHPSQLAGSLSYAYAWTVATAQSQTIGTSTPRSGYAIVVGADELSPEAALVALTRARDETSLWATPENAPTRGWERRRIANANLVRSAIARLEEADPEAGRVAYLLAGVGGTKYSVTEITEMLGESADTITATVERANTALSFDPEFLVVTDKLKAELNRESDDLVVLNPIGAAQRILDFEARDPVERMAQRWGVHGAGLEERAGVTELRMSAEARHTAGKLGVSGCRVLLEMLNESIRTGVLPVAPARLAEARGESDEPTTAEKLSGVEEELRIRRKSLADAEITAELRRALGVPLSQAERRSLAVERGTIAGLEHQVSTLSSADRVFEAESLILDALGAAVASGVGLDARFVGTRAEVARRALAIAEASAAASEAVAKGAESEERFIRGVLVDEAVLGTSVVHTGEIDLQLSGGSGQHQLDSTKVAYEQGGVAVLDRERSSVIEPRDRPAGQGGIGVISSHAQPLKGVGPGSGGRGSGGGSSGGGRDGSPGRPGSPSVDDLVAAFASELASGKTGLAAASQAIESCQGLEEEIAAAGGVAQLAEALLAAHSGESITSLLSSDRPPVVIDLAPAPDAIGDEDIASFEADEDNLGDDIYSEYVEHVASEEDGGWAEDDSNQGDTSPAYLEHAENMVAGEDDVLLRDETEYDGPDDDGYDDDLYAPYSESVADKSEVLPVEDETAGEDPTEDEPSALDAAQTADLSGGDVEDDYDMKLFDEALGFDRSYFEKDHNDLDYPEDYDPTEDEPSELEATQTADLPALWKVFKEIEAGKKAVEKAYAKRVTDADATARIGKGFTYGPQDVEREWELVRSGRQAIEEIKSRPDGTVKKILGTLDSVAADMAAQNPDRGRWTGRVSKDDAVIAQAAGERVEQVTATWPKVSITPAAVATPQARMRLAEEIFKEYAQKDLTPHIAATANHEQLARYIDSAASSAQELRESLAAGHEREIASAKAARQASLDELKESLKLRESVLKKFGPATVERYDATRTALVAAEEEARAVAEAEAEAASGDKLSVDHTHRHRSHKVDGPKKDRSGPRGPRLRGP